MVKDLDKYDYQINEYKKPEFKPYQIKRESSMYYCLKAKKFLLKVDKIEYNKFIV